MTTNNNLMQVMQMLRNSKNPQEFVYNMVEEQAGNNPIFSNLLSLARENRTAEIEQVARNLFKENGLDYDKEFNAFRKSIGI